MGVEGTDFAEKPRDEGRGITIRCLTGGSNKRLVSEGNSTGLDGKSSTEGSEDADCSTTIPGDFGRMTSRRPRLFRSHLAMGAVGDAGGGARSVFHVAFAF